MDETFTLPGYISGLIYDPVQVPACSTIKELRWFCKRWLYGDNVEDVKACTGSRFYFMEVFTHAALAYFSSMSTTRIAVIV